MKNPVQPLRALSMTLLASLICVSSAQAQLNIFDPLNIGRAFGRGQNQQPTQPQGYQPAPQQYNPPQSMPGSRAADQGFPVMPKASAQLNALIQSQLALPITQIGQTGLDMKNIRAIYALHQGRAFWTNDQGMTEMGLALEQNLNAMSVAHGFSPDYYLTSDTVNRMSATDLKSLAELDILLTQGYMLFIKDMTTGRINPKDPSQGLGDIKMKKNAAPSLAALNAITTDQDALSNGMFDMAPKITGYQMLIESLAKLNDGKQAGGWLPITNDRPVLKPGVSHPNIIAIRQRLVDMGFMSFDLRSSQSIVYDRPMYDAVIRFQQENFLDVDGVIGAGSYKKFEITMDQAINQIRANLEKWRLFPKVLPNRYIMVDLGRQELDFIQNNQALDRMKVIVGKDLHGTPTMQDEIDELLLAPYWYLPDSIIINETIPQLSQAYLDSTHIHILGDNGDVSVNSVNWHQYTLQNPPPYTFRQDSGPTNSLGLIKFELNNGDSIYLHDTDAHSLFNEKIRYLSHGCIRLERPFDLAARLLNYSRSAADLQQEASNPATHAKKVAVPSTMVLIFGTTMVNYQDGTVTFGEDIYGQDARIIKALDQMAQPLSAALAIAPAAK